MNKEDIAEILSEIAVLLELKGENPFKIRAYSASARALETLEEDLGLLIEENRLGKVPGIGSAIEEKIIKLFADEPLEFYTELKESIEPGLIEMLEIPSLGPKKIKKLHDALGIVTIEELQEACEGGRVAELKGFGKKTEEKLLAGIKNRELYGQKHLWVNAHARASEVVEYLEVLPEVELISIAGSLRRKKEVVSDVDILVGAESPIPIMDRFVGMASVAEVIAHGETKSSVRLEGGLQIDLRVVPQAQYFFALHHFTGSKEHNVKMRARALTQGMSLSEWGLKSTDDGGSDICEASDEADIFAALGLAYVEPELREGTVELERAESGELPKLIANSDIRGAFHNHTTASDGRNTLEEMAEGARALGWEYLGIADHSKASYQANGLSEERLIKQVDAIRAFNDKHAGTTMPHIFSGTECDILKDGSLDFSSEILGQLDYVVVSVHNAFTVGRDAMTARVIKAMEHEHVTMLGHSTGRLLLKREAYEIDLQRVIDAAIANGVIIELNANPMRLDMDWRLWRQASEKGLVCSINPDAHSVEGLSYVSCGVNIARKGWLESESVLNTWSLDAVSSFLGEK